MTRSPTPPPPPRASRLPARRLTLTTDKGNTMPEPTEYPHHLTVTIDRGGRVHWSITCVASEGADCRMWCDEDCEGNTPKHAEHVLRDQGTCGIAPYFEDSDLIPEMYDGDDTTELHSGPVHLTVNGEWDQTWEYADA